MGRRPPVPVVPSSVDRRSGWLRRDGRAVHEHRAHPDEPGALRQPERDHQGGRPRLFEIRTESTIPWQKRPRGEGSFLNTFEIAPDGEGSRVVYTSEQLRFREPPWGLRYPLLRSVTYRVWIPIWSRRGFRNLLRMAEERSNVASSGAH